MLASQLCKYLRRVHLPSSNCRTCAVLPPARMRAMEAAVKAADTIERTATICTQGTQLSWCNTVAALAIEWPLVQLQSHMVHAAWSMCCALTNVPAAQLADHALRPALRAAVAAASSA